MRTEFGTDAGLVELVSASNSGRLDTGLLARLKFGASVSFRQITGQCSWVLYSHLALAQVQTFVPPACRRPYVVFLHGIEVWRPLSDAQKLILRGAALRLANSAFTAAKARSMHPDIGAVVPCPLALSSAPAGPTGATRAASPTVLIVARMLAAERYKGHDQLLECWAAVRRAIPDAQLVIVGDGDDRARLQSKAEGLGIADSTQFTGFVSGQALADWYERAWIFAMPSRGEGFGLVYLEAMARQLPCIGSTEDAAGEIIRDGDTGYLVRQDDSSALANRIAQLLGDERLRTEMGRRGLERVQQEFTGDRFARRLNVALAPALGTALRRGARSAESCT